MARDSGELVLISPGRRAPLRVTHVITGLERGGAEAMLIKLVATLSPATGFEHAIVSLTSAGIADEVHHAVPVTSLGIRRGSLDPRVLRRLRAAVRAQRPDLVQGWMYHGMIAARLAAGRGVPVVFNVHHTLGRLTDEKLSLRAAIRLGSWLAGGPVERVLYCSETGRRQHEAVGYPPGLSAFIPNGFDCDRFRPAPVAAREAIRREALPTPPGALLVVHVGRYHPLKNHAGLIASFADLANQHDRAHLLLIGAGVTDGQPGLREAVARHSVQGRVHMLGERDDIDHLLPACDMMVLASGSEAFPNVLGEAMACGVPCVTTDVGDAAFIVGDTGRIVPPGDRAALFRAMSELAALPVDERQRLGRLARERIMENFSLTEVARRFAHLYRSLVPEPGAPGGGRQRERNVDP
jgi:glycosyltransferase involved in cell wall biosynthesis